MIGPEKRTAPELSEEYGASVATIHGWKVKFKDKELQRKDKALAELSAIIALQKNLSFVSESKGRLIHRSVKKQILADIEEAVALGAPVYKCCDALSLPARTYYRWRQCTEDKRSRAARVNPRALSEQETEVIVTVC